MTENQLKYKEKIRQNGIQTFKEMNPDLIVLNYINTKSKAEFKCLKCGKIFTRVPNNMKLRNCSCPYCERKIAGNKKPVLRK